MQHLDPRFLDEWFQNGGTASAAGSPTAGDTPPPEATEKLCDSEPQTNADDDSDDGLNPSGPSTLRPDDQPFGCVMKMTQAAFLKVLVHLGSKTPEAGGALFGPKDCALVTHYVPDVRGRGTPVSFTLHAPSLNEHLRQFLAVGMDCKGFAHSHPPGFRRPSGGDLTYVQRLFGDKRNHRLDEVLLPIFCDGELLPFIVEQSLIVSPAKLLLI